MCLYYLERKQWSVTFNMVKDFSTSSMLLTTTNAKYISNTNLVITAKYGVTIIVNTTTGNWEENHYFKKKTNAKEKLQSL